LSESNQVTFAARACFLRANTPGPARTGQTFTPTKGRVITIQIHPNELLGNSEGLPPASVL